MAQSAPCPPLVGTPAFNKENCPFERIPF
ncbi:unnamed protein product [Larinioides sclopetarius]|uniref:Uncharacterized protein n=1 Tax=Larinioides sclopetarius TaxID=280406 RepID=A0AAV2ABM0_9ARAC